MAPNISVIFTAPVQFMPQGCFPDTFVESPEKRHFEEPDNGSKVKCKMTIRTTTKHVPSEAFLEIVLERSTNLESG